MSHYLHYVYVAAGVVFLFGAAIFVHEFGHFWVALKRGLKVEEFAIGFGPKIVSWTRDGIVYSLRWIPAGGFVKLPQMVTSSAIEGGTEAQVPIPPAPALSKILVAVAGPAMNVLFAFVIGTVIYFVGLPVQVNPPFVGYVDPQSAEGKMGILEGDRIVAIDGKPVKSWDEINETTILGLTNVFQVTIQRDHKTNVYALATEANNVMHAKLLNLNSREHLFVNDVAKGSAADMAQIKPDDEIVSLGGAPITSYQELTNLVQTRGGQKTAMVVLRGKARVEVELTPALDPSTKRYVLGIHFVPGGGRDYYDIEHPTPWAQIATVCDKLWRTVQALVHPHESGVRVTDLSGPVGIAGALAVEFNTDYRLALSFLVLLNINLAILNMLPIPVLDGGHIAMAILESIRRRPLEVRFVEYTTTAFAILLICFMVVVTVLGDFRRIPLIQSLLKHETKIEQAPPPGTPSP